MYDNICTLPLTSDIFTQAIHPTLPILSVGLSSGHVQTYQLPSDELPSPSTNGTHTGPKTTLPSALSSSQTNGTSSSSRRNSGNGFDVVDTLWRTRRHKGSCRALAFSTDGSTLFSAGSDGIIKAAANLTGRVHAKIRVPVHEKSGAVEVPSVLCALSPRALLLGTDTGAAYVFELEEREVEGAGRVLAMKDGKEGKEVRTWRPHVTEDDPGFAEAITSITALPPSGESTSGTCRTWVSTAGGSVAITDLRKGVVACSVDQGDVLLSSGCVGLGSVLGKRKGGAVNGVSKSGSAEMVLIGGANGVLTVWERGDMQDRKGSIIVQRDGGGVTDESTIDCMAAVPSGGKVVAVGLGNGAIKFVQLRGRGGEVIEELAHDEHSADGVTTLGFDVEGRMISGGGESLKIWHPAKDGAETNGGDVEDEEEAAVVQMGDGSEDEDEELGSDSDEAPKKRKKKKRKKTLKITGKFGEHGVMAFSDMV